VSALALAAATLAAPATARTIYLPLSHGIYRAPIHALHHVGPYLPPYVDRDPKSKSGTWTDIKGSLPFVDGPDTALQLTDGTVIEHDYCASEWFKLTPDKKGKYETGTWSAIASLPAGYFPFFFASQVMPDGRVLMNGGEYNSAEHTCGSGAWTNKGALYDPVANSWTSVSPPAGWARIGDAQSIVLPNGSYMLANCCSNQNTIASISGTTVTWTNTGSGKGDENDEEGWTALPGGSVLTVDANRALTGGPNDVEIYTTKKGTWTTVGTTFSELVDPTSHELGPAVLRPDGNVIYFGATTNNNLYNTSTGTWTAAPAFPDSGYDVADGPAALLPDGNVLVQASPGVFGTPSHFYEFSLSKKGKASLVNVNDPSSATTISSFEGRMMNLPTGQILWSNDGQAGTPEVATYTPQGKAKASWLPSVSTMPSKLTRGSTNNAFAGTNFNGFSLGGTYGDDAQEATNFPLVRVTNTSTGDVCFAKTHSFSTMGVFTSGTTTAQFDVPSTCETGASTVQVIVNGLASAATNVTVK
jgi:hypothetical protein